MINPGDPLADSRSVAEASSLLPVLRNRNFLLLWTAQAISMTAQNATWFALAIIVEEHTRSSIQMSLVILTSIIPAVALGLVAGALVDRMNKKHVLVATNLLRAITVLGYLFYGQALFVIYLVNVVFISISQFFGPAEYAVIPAVVPRRQLVGANSLYNLTFNGSQLVGIVIIAPLMLKLFGPEALFIGEAVAYLVATLLMTVLPPDEAIIRQAPANGTSKRKASEVWREIREGWDTMKADPYIGLAVGHLTLLAALILTVAMLGPRFTVSVLDIRADDAVLLLAPAVVGILIGTVTISRLVNRYGKERITVVGLFALGIGILLLSSLRWIGQNVPRFVPSSLGILESPRAVGLVPIMMMLTVAMGFAIAMVMVPAQTTVMERAVPQVRGRIFSVQLLMGNLASIPPLIFLGGLADVLAVDVVVAMLGALVLLAAIYTVRYLHRLDKLGIEPGPRPLSDHGCSPGT